MVMVAMTMAVAVAPMIVVMVLVVVVVVGAGHPLPMSHRRCAGSMRLDAQPLVVEAFIPVFERFADSLEPAAPKLALAG